MSTYRGITVNGCRAYQSARTLQLETTSLGAGTDQHITALIVEGDESMHLTISLRDARELAGWLIEHAVDPEAAPDAGGAGTPRHHQLDGIEASTLMIDRHCDAMDPHKPHRWCTEADVHLVEPTWYHCPGHG